MGAQMQKPKAASCYACDAPTVGLAFQWVGGVPLARRACRRHAWARGLWPR